MTDTPVKMTSGLFRILIVDTRTDVTQSLVGFLSEFEDLAVFRCSPEPKTVLTFIEEVHPEVIILDLEAEGVTDWKTVRQIKNLPQAPVVIILSDYYLDPIPRSAGAAGVDHFIVKTTECERLQVLLLDLALEKRARSPVDRFITIESNRAVSRSQRPPQVRKGKAFTVH